MISPTTRKDINLFVKKFVSPLFILLSEHAARCYFFDILNLKWELR